MKFDTLRIWLTAGPWKWPKLLDEWEAVVSYSHADLVKDLEAVSVHAGSLAQFIRSQRGIGRPATPNAKYNAQQTAQRVARALRRPDADEFHLQFVQREKPAK